MTYPTITLSQLERLLDEGRKLQLIDVRDKASYDRGHLDKAISIPFVDLEDHLNVLDPALPVVCYCARGAQSMLACRLLSDRGFQAVNVAGGMAWYRGKHLVR